MNKINNLKVGLIFTLDYEIHGNGSGEFKNWAYLPTSQMLNTFDNYGAKLTIMAEMGHYWAMKKLENIFHEDIALFESQLKDAIQRGHDVQLHFHPQWIDAKFEDGAWKLDFSLKSIGRLCHNYEEAFFYLSKGKAELQELLTPVNPNYKCCCYRAGFLQMQPSEIMIKAMIDAGFKSDTSVSKGMKSKNALISQDYSSAFSNYRPWKINNSDICKRDDEGKIYEFPIFSTYAGINDKIIRRLKNIPKRKKIDEVFSHFMETQGKWMATADETGFTFEKFKRAVTKRWFYIDFCSRNHLDLTGDLKKAISTLKKNKDYNYIPLVLIGHSKDFFFANNLAMFLKECQSIDEVDFVTYSTGLEKYFQNSK